MTSKRCFIRGCYYKDENEGRTPVFSIPKPFAENLKKWQELIPKPGLKTSSRLCSRHFDDDDIIKGRQILDVFYPQKWRLKAGALPKNFLDIPLKDKESQPQKVVDKNGCRSKNQGTKGKTQLKSKQLIAVLGDKPAGDKENTVSWVNTDSSATLPRDPPPHQLCLEEGTTTSVAIYAANLDHMYFRQVGNPSAAQPHSSGIELNTPSSIVDSVPIDGDSRHSSFSGATGCPFPEPTSPQPGTNSGTPIDATFYKEMVDRVKLPSGCWTWTFNSVDNMAYCISCRAAPHGGIVVKTLRIVSTTKANLYVGEKLVTLPSGDGHFENYEQLSGLLAYFHDRNPCRGIVDPSLLDVPVTKACSILQYGNTRRSTSCSFLAERDSLCTSCRKAQRYIKKRLRDGVISSPEEIRLKHRNKLQMKNRLIQRLQAKKKELNSLLEDMILSSRVLKSNIAARSRKGAKRIIYLMLYKKRIYPQLNAKPSNAEDANTKL